MQITTLTAVSPIDGRYSSATQHLSDYFSEYALIKYRLHVEIEYFIFLSDKKVNKRECSFVGEEHQQRLLAKSIPIEANLVHQ